MEHGWHIGPTCTGTDAIEAVTIAIGEAERLAGRPLAEALPVDPDTGKLALASKSGSAVSPMTSPGWHLRRVETRSSRRPRGRSPRRRRRHAVRLGRE
jgi:hypothetical protein